MASRSALASLPTRLRPTSAAMAAGGWRRLLSDDPTKGRKDEDKRLKDPNVVEGLPMESTELPEGMAEKDRFEQSWNKMKELKDKLEKAEVENRFLKNQIHKAENENSFKDELEQSKKETKQLKDQLEKAEAEKQYLKDKIHKELETIICKQTMKFESKLANERMHIDETVRKMENRSEEIKKDIKADVFHLKTKCSRRAEIGEKATTVLRDKNVNFQDELIVKVQQAQYSVVKTTALAGAMIGVVVFVVLRFFKRGE